MQRIDIFYELGLKPWDVATGHMLIEEAGGIVTRFDGSPHQLSGGEILASNAHLGPLARTILAEARAKHTGATAA